MMGFGDLSTRKVIDLLRHGLERCIVCLVKPEKSNLPIDEVSLTRGKINGVIRLLPQNSKLQTPKSYPQDIHMLFTGRAPAGTSVSSSLKLLEFPWFEDLDVLLPGKQRLTLEFGRKKRANKSPFYRPNRSLDY